jgi:hypothetical protein
VRVWADEVRRIDLQSCWASCCILTWRLLKEGNCRDFWRPILPTTNHYPATTKEIRWFRSLQKALCVMNERDRRLLLDLTSRMVSLRNKRAFRKIDVRDVRKPSEVLHLPKCSPATPSRPPARAVGNEFSLRRDLTILPIQLTEPPTGFGRRLIPSFTECPNLTAQRRCSCKCASPSSKSNESGQSFRPRFFSAFPPCVV